MKKLQLNESKSIPSAYKIFNYWLGMAAVTAGFSGFAIFAQMDSLQVGQAVNELLSFKLTRYSNVLLTTSGVVYISHLWLRRSIVGKWATGLATAGVVGLGIAFLTRWYESYQVLEVGHIPVSNLYEVTVFFTLLTVCMYLVMESFYQSKAAGAFIMPIALSSIGLQLWLESSGYATPDELVPALQSYWMHTHVLANFIGYGAFSVACGAGFMYLFRYRAEKYNTLENSVASNLPELNIIDDWIYRSIAIGFPVFTLATVLGSAWAYYAWGSYWSWDPKETWALIVLLNYAGFLHARFMKGWKGIAMAWWAIIGFIITMFCFLGVNLFLSGLHSYGGVS